MNLPDAPIAREGFFATHFFTVSGLDKSKDFYVRIFGAKVIKPDSSCYIKLANTWLLLNSGGGPTPDKPEVLLETRFVGEWHGSKDCSHRRMVPMAPTFRILQVQDV